MSAPWERIQWWEQQGLPTVDDDPRWNDLYVALGSDDWQFRSQLVRWLVPQTHPRLIALLLQAMGDDENANRRNTALQVLVQKGRSITGLLRSLLESDHDDIRLFACQLAGQTRNARLVDSLLQRLNDTNPNVVTAAIEALGRIGDERALPYLRQLLQRDDPWFQFEVCSALGAIGHPDGLADLDRFRDHPILRPAVIASLAHFFHPTAFAWAVDFLRDADTAEMTLQATLAWFRRAWPDDWMRAYVREFHVWCSATSTASDIDLTPWLQHRSSDIVESALYWGCLLNRPEWRQWLIRNLTQPLMTQTLIQLFPWMQPLPVEEAQTLVAHMQEPEVLHHWLVWHVHTIIGTPILHDLHARWDRLNPETHYLLMHTLLPRQSLEENWPWLVNAWQMRDAKLQQLIVTWFTDTDTEESVRTALIQRTADWQTSPDGWQRAVVVDIEARLAPDDFMQRAQHYLQDPDPWVRFRAIQGIVDHHTETADTERLHTWFQTALVDEHPAIRETAIRHYPLNLPDAPAVLEAMLHHPEIWIQIAAIRRMAEARFPDMDRMLIDHYKRAEPPVQIEILKHLGRWDSPTVWKFYSDLYARVDSVQQRAVLEGMVHMRSSADDVFAFATATFRPELETALKVRILTTIARLTPDRADAWLAQHEDTLDYWLSSGDWMTVLSASAFPTLPQWAIPWLYDAGTWSDWLAIVRLKPTWRAAVRAHAPYRLQQWIDFLSER